MYDKFFLQGEIAMNEFANYFEYAVDAKVEGKLLRNRILLIIGYVLYAIGFMVLVFASKLLPLGAFVVVTTAIIVFFTWRYVNIEYEYTIVKGEMTFSKIFGRRSRRDFLKVRIQDMSHFAPYKDEYKAIADSATKKYYAVSSMSSPDVYVGIFKEPKSNETSAVFFEATSGCLRLAKFYNKSATVMSDTLRY